MPAPYGLKNAQREVRALRWWIRCDRGIEDPDLSGFCRLCCNTLEICRGCGELAEECCCKRLLKHGTRPCPSCRPDAPLIALAPSDADTIDPRCQSAKTARERPSRVIRSGGWMFWLRWTTVGVVVYISCAYLIRGIRPPEITQTKLFLSFWEAITWR